MTVNQFGKVSKVNLTLEKSGERSFLSHVDFTAPFKVMKPFYDEKNQFSLMIMSSSAGIMSGDRQEISVTVGEGAKGKIYSQSYEKIHKMLEGFGERNTVISVKSGGILEYSPLPTIPYADSYFQGKTEIFLEDSSSQLVFSEILSCGRVAMGEVFQYGLYQSKVSVFCGEQLIYSDKVKFQPKEMDLGGFCFQEGYTHQSTMVLFHFGVTKEGAEEVQRYLEGLEESVGGFSETVYGDLVFRFLGGSGEALQKTHGDILDILRILRV